jgi:FixJ family two-component response regulator
MLDSTTLFLVTGSQALSALAREVAPLLDLALEELRLQKQADLAVLRKRTREQRGIVLLDLGLAPPGERAAAVERLAGSPFGAPVVAFVQHVTPPIVVRLMRAGAFDVVSSDIRGVALQQGLMHALAEEARRYPRRQAVAKARQRFARLSPRERQVLQGVLEGKLSKQIARDLGLRDNTVEVHRAHAMRKLGTWSPLAVARSLALCELDDDGRSPLA